MHVQKFNEEYRTAELQRASRSLGYFAQAHMGFPDLNRFDYELCAVLEGRPPYKPWNRLLASKYRSGRKSTITTMAYPMWRALFIVDFATKLIENSSDNAKKNHFLPIVELFCTGPRSEYLTWLYSHRIPGVAKGDDREPWAGTNSERLVLIKESFYAADALSYWGVNSKFEGWHGNLVVLDDAQGTDTEDSEVGAEEGWRAYRRSIPLLIHPLRGQIIVVGVPPINGNRSFVHEVKEQYARGLAA